MPFNTFLTCLALMSTTGWAQYVLEDDYLANGNFFDMFSFWNTGDPTNGFVSYADRQTAQNDGLINAASGQVTMGVDHTNVASNGRSSVRITSNKSYDSGLVILDLEHMPGGICGTWPAFWMVGPDWPSQGEIDIIEGVNDQSTNDFTLHTGPGCTISSDGGMSGSIATSNCDINAAGQGNNQGCQITTPNTQTYGSGFNANNGGVYAVDWTANAISIYFFPRGSIPSDISTGAPMPSGWGNPMAKFQGGCDISSTFKNQQIVFDTTFCGDWAGNTWGSSSCASQADTCNAFVQNHPEAFADAYWAINSLKVYQNYGGTSSSWVATSEPASSSYGVSSTVSATEFVSVPANSTSAVSATTFEFSTKPSMVPTTTLTLPQSTVTLTHTPFAPNASSVYPAGNATNSVLPTGSGAASASIIVTAPTGTVSSTILGSATGAVPSLSATASTASAPRSPPEISSAVSTTSSADAATTPAAATSTYDWQSRESDGPWTRHHHHNPPSVKERHARHLRQHKRHGSGRL